VESGSLSARRKGEDAEGDTGSLKHVKAEGEVAMTNMPPSIATEKGEMDEKELSSLEDSTGTITQLVQFPIRGTAAGAVFRPDSKTLDYIIQLTGCVKIQMTGRSSDKVREVVVEVPTIEVGMRVLKIVRRLEKAEERGREYVENETEKLKKRSEEKKSEAEQARDVRTRGHATPRAATPKDAHVKEEGAAHSESPPADDGAGQGRQQEAPGSAHTP
jgi:hypothetical protein